ncbi:MAG: hypothetical protein FD153_1839, partial [Rhodospirillaceae bacterium]
GLKVRYHITDRRIETALQRARAAADPAMVHAFQTWRDNQAVPFVFA